MVAVIRPLWRAVQLTDTHLFGKPEGTLLGLNTYRSFQAVLQAMQQTYWPVDLLLATGDLAQDGTLNAYHLLAQELLALDTPTYWLPGNHDQPSNMRQVLDQGKISPHKQVLLSPWQIILLDSTVPKEVGGHLDDEQLAFLTTCLEAHPDHYALVCLHHHPLSINCSWMEPIGLSNGPEFLGILKGFPQVKGVLWGHIHQDYETVWEGIQLMASPSTCVQFKPETTAFALDSVLPGYRWFEFYGDGTFKTGIHRLTSLGLGQVLDMASQGY
jgi:3',5'-cyclic-AMP phosphodiesterase